jgi:isoleucyl-tRNA synthetase
VKDADKNIIKHLKAVGRLVTAGTVKHSYPFCWRSETPLIYRAIPSWFMRVSQMQAGDFTLLPSCSLYVPIFDF